MYLTLSLFFIPFDFYLHLPTIDLYEPIYSVTPLFDTI